MIIRVRSSIYQATGSKIVNKTQERVIFEAIYVEDYLITISAKLFVNSDYWFQLLCFKFKYRYIRVTGHSIYIATIFLLKLFRFLINSLREEDSYLSMDQNRFSIYSLRFIQVTFL